MTGSEQDVEKTTHCIRCDADVSQDPFEGLTLVFNQETGAVKACQDCLEIVKRRDYLK